MRIIHAAHINHGFGYCDLYGIDLENDYARNTGGTMGETDYEKGFNSFTDSDPTHPRRIPPAGLSDLRLYEWFRGWDTAQELWKTAMRNRSAR